MLAEEMTDVLGVVFDLPTRGTTHGSPLPRGDVIAVRYVLAHEHARTVDHVARRTRLGLGACVEETRA